jgi:hypothetical protein
MNPSCPKILLIRAGKKEKERKKGHSPCKQICVEEDNHSKWGRPEMIEDGPRR